VVFSALIFLQTKNIKMKKILISILLASAVFIAGSCKKTIKYTAQRNMTNAADALLKINYLSAYNSNPSVQLSVNAVRVSGLIAGRTPFPGGGFNTNGSNYPDYLQVTPGTNLLSISIPKKLTNIDSVLLFASNLSLQAGKNYTAHITDTFNKTKMLVVEDDLWLPDNGQARYKFLNMMPNVPLIDLYYGANKIASAIPYLNSSAYFNLPSVPAITDTFKIRETGTLPTSTALAFYVSTNTVLNQRVYTVFALGYKGSSATNTKPYVSFLLNK
jgi:hypothetical protein